jgi:hypothetical protein
MTKRYLVEFISTVTEKFTAEVDVPDHIADDDLRQYLQEQVAGSPLELMDMTLQSQDVLASYLTDYEETKEDTSKW